VVALRQVESILCQLLKAILSNFLTFDEQQYFQCEHDVYRNILNEMGKQYKAIDVELLDEKGRAIEVASVKDSVFSKSGVNIRAPLELGCQEFKAGILIDANGTTGPFAVCFRKSHRSSGLQR
jgi:hypothetical protein